MPGWYLNVDLFDLDGVEICTGKGDMNLYGFSSEFP